MHLLENSDRTEYQLRQKLLESEYPEDLVVDAIDYVKGYHYVDDARFADCYVRLRGASKSRGNFENSGCYDNYGKRSNSDNASVVHRKLWNAWQVCVE